MGPITALEIKWRLEVREEVLARYIAEVDRAVVLPRIREYLFLCEIEIKIDLIKQEIAEMARAAMREVDAILGLAS